MCFDETIRIEKIFLDLNIQLVWKQFVWKKISDPYISNSLIGYLTYIKTIHIDNPRFIFNSYGNFPKNPRSVFNLIWVRNELGIRKKEGNILNPSLKRIGTQGSLDHIKNPFADTLQSPV